MNKFEIFKDGAKTIIKRNVYPKFTGEITFAGIPSDIENIIWEDELKDVMDGARAMREAGDYIVDFLEKG